MANFRALLVDTFTAFALTVLNMIIIGVFFFTNMTGKGSAMFIYASALTTIIVSSILFFFNLLLLLKDAELLGVYNKYILSVLLFINNLWFVTELHDSKLLSKGFGLSIFTVVYLALILKYLEPDREEFDEK
jgi:hypothetical protein